MTSHCELLAMHWLYSPTEFRVAVWIRMGLRQIQGLHAFPAHAGHDPLHYFPRQWRRAM